MHRKNGSMSGYKTLERNIYEAAHRTFRKQIMAYLSAHVEYYVIING